MADYIVIDGVRPWDGSYELDLEAQPLTTTEWGWVKRRAGYLPLTLTGEAWADPELIAVLAAVAVRRAGVVETREMDGLIDRLFEAPFGHTIRLEAGEDEAGDADGPPTSSSEPRPSSNGDSSTTASERSASPAAATGARSSDTSESAPTMSAS